MSSSNDLSKDPDAGGEASDLAKVWVDLLKGEKTAQVLESNLANLEKKIDDLLAGFDESEHTKVEEANSRTSKPSKGKNGDADAGP
ncbi:hypothetical protein BJ875DRAFT_488184 [Amylocarpus encephaloides]|uniref:Uncharacterized protein n=1 Tax=Amylocarpus encephaloides TaxID=45428 RepID=A0A9P7YAP4_9HELO|nr:hypothetical protein BJ875DRAFT_488184 [Amylocarpus encephaloides]